MLTFYHVLAGIPLPGTVCYNNAMQAALPQTIVFTDRIALMRAVRQAMDAHGNDCDLNHFDVSGVTDFRSVFENLPFNGDISRWDVSNAFDMLCMFSNTPFQGDLSHWNVSKVQNFAAMFQQSEFTGDLLTWSIHKDAILTDALSPLQMASPTPTVFHWHNAIKQPDNLASGPREHFDALMPIAQGLDLGSHEDIAFWLDAQWRKKMQPQESVPLPELQWE